MMTRREMLGVVASAPFLGASASLFGAEGGHARRLGVCIYSYGHHWRSARESGAKAAFTNSLEFLEFCHERNAGGVQISIGSTELDYIHKLRTKAEAYQMYFEGQATLPRDEGDVTRFESEIRASREAGAEVVRAAMLGTRRYETFNSAGDFRKFADRSWRSLTLAEPVLKRHRVRLALENHKDWRVPELLDLLKRIGSEYVGVCVDTGNSIALLEDPMSVVEAYAPWAASTHLKDMAVEVCEAGFLLSEVPLGEGFLDLKRMIAVLLKANPKIQFNLEMITRDPLTIPCLTPKYWATLDMVPASQLANMLTLIRANLPRKPLPRVAGLTSAERLKFEDANVRESFGFARERLAL